MISSLESVKSNSIKFLIHRRKVQKTTLHIEDTEETFNQQDTQYC